MTDNLPFALRGDRPIESAEEDRLGRAAFARAIAEQVLTAPSLDSYVVAVMGPWGTGKTSLLNMIAEEITLRSDSAILRFNPWIFSGTEQLVGYFFRELGAQFSELKNDRLSKVGASLQRYAGLFGTVAGFIPTVGDTLKKGADLAKDLGATIAAPPSVESLRDKIREQLKSQEQRVVVLVDDIDRLRRDEIRELVKLVRLTGDFPNVTYLLAFDRKRVEEALGDGDETGRAYMEKIVQVAYDVPLPLELDITKLLLSELERATSGIGHGPFNEGEWANIFHLVIRPLVTSPRDVRRYVNALPPTLRVIGAEVSFVDVLALEAVRTFLPDIFGDLGRLVEALTDPPGHFGHSSSPINPHAEAVKGLVEKAGPKRTIVRELVTRLFPHAARHLGGSHFGEGWARQWAKRRKVALPGPLRFYLERRLPDGVAPASAVDRIYAALGDRARVTEILDQMTPATLEDVMGRLEAFEEDFPPTVVEPAIAAFLDQIGRLREGKQHFLDFGSQLALDRLVLRLLRRVPDEPSRESIVEHVLGSLRWLSAGRALVRVATGHSLISKEKSVMLGEMISRSVVNAKPEQLAGERQLGALLVEVVERGGSGAETVIGFLEDDRVFGRLLASVMAEQSSWSPGNVTSVQEIRIPWRDLCLKFGEDRMKTRTTQARANLASADVDPAVDRALDLAAKYASGWAPKDRSEDRDDDDDDVPDSGAAEVEAETS